MENHLISSNFWDNWTWFMLELLSFYIPIITYVIALIIVLLCLYFLKNYRKNVKLIFENILLLYKNFIHWNISKLIIAIYSTILWFIFSIPFLAMCIYFIYKLSDKFDPKSIDLLMYTWSIDSNLITSFVENIWTIFGVIVSLILIVCLFIFTFMYWYFLLQNVYKSYIEWKRLWYLKNFYFSWKYMWKYLWTLSWVALYMLIPLWIWLLWFIVLAILWFFWIINENMTFIENMILWWSTIIFFILLFVFFIYLWVRLTFSYIALLYTKKVVQNTSVYIKESFKISKWKVLKIIWLIVPVTLVIIWVQFLFNKMPFNWNLWNFILDLISFFTIEWISYMTYMSVYLLLKKEKNL